MDPQNILLKHAAELFFVLVAMIGGVVRSLDGYLHTGVFPKIQMLFAHAVVSGFSGYMTAQVVTRFEPNWALVGAGIGGYLGTQGLDWAATVIKNRFGGDLK